MCSWTFHKYFTKASVVAVEIKEVKYENKKVSEDVKK